MEQHSLFFRFGVALFIGLLVGLQREYAYDESGDSHEKTFASGFLVVSLALRG